ncbi:glycosyl hydrolase [Leptospira langatensis]|uniref:Glycosyl hydrolase n=2 Tax=Leptospira langatensis TaxID=2484983 RepID=A0A5F1ZRJ8_9LEPT|nr:glycosyl hydrolase family 18 protein [Leptospira langatensis]TGJ99023.1 glycosyl hydrolase [Leptospira langatensis]TGL40408.1 glycosyl hydrolase [Leptospira langatensis]
MFPNRILSFLVFISLLIHFQTCSLSETERKNESNLKNSVSMERVRASTWSQDFFAMMKYIHLYDEMHPFIYNLEGGRKNTGRILSVWKPDEIAERIQWLRIMSPRTLIIPTIFRWENDFEKVADVIGLNGNTKTRDFHIQSILKEVEKYGYDGIDIDYEGMTCEKKEAFQEFLILLRDELHKRGKLLSVAIHPKTLAEKPSVYSCKGLKSPIQVDFYEAYRGQLTHDYEFLGKVADKVKIMAYELHPRKNGFPGPGPQAPDWWIDRILEYASGRIPNEKLYMAIPTYGYDWPLNCDIDSKSVYYSRAKWIQDKMLPRKEEPTDILEIFKTQPKLGDWKYLRPYLYRHEGHVYSDPSLWYRMGGCDRVAFYMNRSAFEAKMKILEKYKIRGFSFWQLIEDNDPEINRYLEEKLGEGK